MGNGSYLHTSPQHQSNAMCAFVVNPSRSDTYQAMIATVETPIDGVTEEVNTDESADILERAIKTFKDLRLWMLQRYATADVNADVNEDPMLLKSIAESAKEIITLRIGIDTGFSPRNTGFFSKHTGFFSRLNFILDFSRGIPDFSLEIKSTKLDSSRLFCGPYVRKNYDYRRLEA